MPPAVTRELSVIYGSITLGGTSDAYYLDGPIEVTEGPDLATFGCTFVLRAASEAAFEDEIRTVETALRTPRKRLRVVLGSETLYDWNPGAGINSGFNQRPQLVEAGDPVVDSGRSVRYRFRCEIDLPADRYDQAGRRDSSVSLSYTASRVKTISISGEYRALTAFDSARARYLASISAFEAAIKTALGGTYDLVSETSRADDTDKICTFERSYKEIPLNQAIGVLDHPAIVAPQFTAAATTEYPGDSPGKTVSRLVQLSVSWSCAVDRTVTQDLRELFEGTIRPWIFARVTAIFGGAIAILSGGPTYDQYENMISASFQMLTTGGGTVLEYRVTTEIKDLTGVVLTAIWTGAPYDRYVYSGPASRVRTTTETTQVLGTVTNPALAKTPVRGQRGGGGGGVGFGIFGFGGAHNPGIKGNIFGGGIGFGGVHAPGIRVSFPGGGAFGGPGGAGGAGGGGGAGHGRWYLTMQVHTTTPLIKGNPALGPTIAVTDMSTVTVEEWATPYRGSAQFVSRSS